MRRTWMIAATVWAGAHPHARAMDCAKSSTAIERAICGDPALRTQDAELSRLYFTTLKTLAGQRHDALIEDQKDWLRSRDAKCSVAKNSIVPGCIATSTETRKGLIVACFAGTTPDPKASDATCTIAAHKACPEYHMAAAAKAWAYPFLVATIEKMAAQARDDAGDKETCAPENADHPGSPDQASDDYVMSIVGSGPGWISVREDNDTMGRGAAHPSHSETVSVYETDTGKAFPIDRLMPALKTQPPTSKALWEAANKTLSIPCCGSDTEKQTLEDLRSDAGDGVGRPLPDGWSIDAKGGLTVFYSYNAMARDFLAQAVIPRAVYIGWVDARYRALFAERK